MLAGAARICNRGGHKRKQWGAFMPSSRRSDHKQIKAATFAGCTGLAVFLLVAGCGGGGKPSGPPVTTSSFTTIVPKGFEGNSPGGAGVCAETQLMCLVTSAQANGANATIVADKAQTQAPDSQLSSAVQSAAKDYEGQNVQISSTTVGGEHAEQAQFSSPGGGVAAENWDFVRVNHAGTTYLIDLGARSDIPNAQSLYTSSYQPAYQQVLKAWKWR
jgi:hypothetical protein